MRQAAVIGAGAAGLACALALQEGGRQVTLLEAAPRVGGRIGSERHGDYLVESGPASLAEGWSGLSPLIERVGLKGDLVTSDDRASRRYVFHGGRMRTVPGKPPQIITSDILPLSAKLRVLAEPFISRAQDPDESIGAFARRRLGRDVAELLVDAVLSGIYAGDMDRLSLRAAMPRLHALEQEHGSLVRGGMAAARARRQGRAAAAAPSPPGGRHLMSFRRGLWQLPEAMAAALQRAGGAVCTGCAVQALQRDASGWRLTVAGGEVRADDVVVALPPPAAQALLRPLDEALADAYAAIPMAPIVAVALAYDREAVAHPLDGFGFLIPRREGVRLLGAIFMSSALPGFAQAPPGQVMVRAMIGGAHDPGAVDLSDEALAELAHQGLSVPLGLRAAPRFRHVQRWPQAIEQYVIGHSDRVATIEGRLRSLGLWACGASLHGISVPDVMQDGQRAAAAVLAG